MMRRRVPLTDEDWDIWILRLGAHTLRCPLYEVSIAQDRRDAELMYVLTRVQMRETHDNSTWVAGGPDGDFVQIRPAARIYVDSHL